jgi:acetyltransferase-like isoleucine patch superfamily enzyme
MQQHPIEIIGQGKVIIGERVSLSGQIQVIFQKPSTLTIGDYCTLGTGVKFVSDGGDITLGDWTTLHDRCLVLSGTGTHIGQHAWFGQHSVLDGTGGLTIGNGVRVGMYSQIWSHVAAGEQIEGCTLFGTRPVTIEDNVWLVGSCIVASGVTLGQKTVALIGSNITKSWPAHSVIAGSPAACKESLNFYRPIDPSEQWQFLQNWMHEISRSLKIEPISPSGHTDKIFLYASSDQQEHIVFAKDTQAEAYALTAYPRATICTLSTKQYRKRLTDLEHNVLKALAGNKARFLCHSHTAAITL